MQTQIHVRQEKTILRKLRQCLGLLLFSLVLTACGQGSDPQQGVISDDKLSAPLPKAIITRSIDGSTLIVDVIVNGDTDNPLRVKNLVVDTTAGTFSGNVPEFPTGPHILSLVYSIIHPTLGTIEVMRTSNIIVEVTANKNTSADFSDADIFYTVSGQVEGLIGSELILQNNGDDNLTINANGAFSFSNALVDGSEYAVSVLTQPGNPNQICTVSNGSDTINDAPISRVNVICNPNTAPTATSVAITDVNGGNTVAGNLLNGIYTYSDTESDTEGVSTFRWLISGVAIAGATTTRYVPVAGDVGKTITFEVTPVATTGVTTGAAASSDGREIVENSASFFTSGIAISVAEDIVVTGYTATVQDPDGDTVTFSLSGGTDQAAFSIDSDSGVLSFNVTTRFKNPVDSDGNNTYVVDITATDGIHSIDRIVTVTVTMAILEVSVSTADIKTVRFEWPAYVDATSYKLFVNPDGDSGFSPVQDSFSETSTTITLPVHLTDWINVRYMLEAYDASDNKLTESSPVSITAVMLSSIGYVKASNTESSDFFGKAVSLSADGNTLAVGAIGEDSITTAANLGSGGSGKDNNTAANSGAVYVFSRNDDIWVQQAYIKASNTETEDEFGKTVSLSSDGNTLAVGASGEDSAATDISSDTSGENDNTAEDAGAVYVFSRNDGGVWNQQAYVKASNTEAGDGFGKAVSLSADGSTLTVGAPEKSGARGAVYVFSRNSGTWSQQAYVKASNAGSNDRFGNVVSLSNNGNTLAVGAGGEDSAATGISTDGSGEDDNTASSSGAVYVFSRSGGDWNQQAYVKASNTQLDDRFGTAVCLSADGNMLVVGAPGEDSAATDIGTDDSDEADNAASSAGAVYVFSRSDGDWSQQAYVKASNTGRSDRFGRAMSLSGDGNMLVVGAPGEDSAATGVGADDSDEADNAADSAGAVYVFSRSAGVWSQQTYVKASNTGQDDNFGGAVSLSDDGNMLAVGASQENGDTTSISSGGSTNNSANDAGAVYLY